ncbi:hypothetical protein PORY_002179 [Pneumocystis oryctolagi]|uniref:Uncharacterized protein n=1 Tax=Pneumocystis oryctolagi TaxID=42067 RepID=A0ACB7CCA4_9ASCO|nr:hypothetical protein PORY_002179 [Pneumocystis oryctolagi]
MKIKRLPKILTLHLKRFKYIEENGNYKLSKLFHTVVYPYYLRLSNTTDDVDNPDRLYELYAVIVHLGSGSCYGHYVSVIKTESGWTLFDDERVEPVNEMFVRRFFGNFPGEATAYILFYQTADTSIQNESNVFDTKASLENLGKNQSTKSAFELLNFYEQTFEPTTLNPSLSNKIDIGVGSLKSSTLAHLPSHLLRPLEPALCTELPLCLNRRSFLRGRYDSLYSSSLSNINVCSESNIFYERIHNKVENKEKNRNTFIQQTGFFFQKMFFDKDKNKKEEILDKNL